MTKRSGTIKIRDQNLKLAMLSGLVREKLLPRSDLATFERTLRDMSDESSLADIAAIPVAAAQLARLRELSWPDEPDIPMCCESAEPEDFEIADLGGIEHCTGLEQLALVYFAVTDLAPLAALTKLRRIALDAPNVSELRPISTLALLEELSLSHTKVTDLQPLARLPKLAELRMSWAYGVGRTSNLRSKNQSTVDELTRRKVKQELAWPTTRAEEQVAADAKTEKRERARAAKAGPAATPATNPALEAQIVERLEDDAARMIYADWLQAHGDPRGQLVMLDRELARNNDRALSTERRKVLETHGAYLLGRFADSLYADVFKLEWRAGFIRAADFPHTNTGVDSGVLLSELLALPTARFLEELTIGNQYFDDGDGAAFDVLGAARPAPPLRSLTITAGGFTGGGSDEGELAAFGNLAKLAKLYPGLRKLHFEGEPNLDGIDLPELVELAILSSDLPRRLIAAIGKARWPKLERLELRYGTWSSGDSKPLAPIFDGKQFPRLAHLALRAAPFGDAIAAILPSAPLLRRLVTLDLSETDMTTVGADSLLSAAAAFARLQLLDIRGCDVEPRQRRALAKLCTKVRL